MKTTWTDNERRGLLAFLCIEGAVILGLGQIGACFSSMGNNLDTFSDAFVKGAAKTGTWFGALSIPVSIAWMYWGAVSRNRDHPRLAEIAKVLSLEIVVIVFLAVFFVELGPPALEPAPKWSDLKVFGIVLFVMSVLSVLGLGIAWTGMKSASTLRAKRAPKRKEDGPDTPGDDGATMA